MVYYQNKKGSLKGIKSAIFVQNKTLAIMQGFKKGVKNNMRYYLRCLKSLISAL